MSPTEILNSLTPSQREEFDNDIKELVIKAGKEYNFDSAKVAEVNTNMRIQDKIFLNVSLTFHCNEKGEVNGTITAMKRFDTVDEYLDSINDSKNLPEGFSSIK